MNQTFIRYSAVVLILLLFASNACDAQNPSEARALSDSDNDVALARKMNAICRELKLFNIGGIPISGSLPSGVFSSAEKKRFEYGQQQLADRILLGLLPGLFSPEVEARNGKSRRNVNSRRSKAPRDFNLLIRVLGKETMSRYYNSRTRSWVGTDVFAQREALRRFLKEQGPTLRKLTLQPPLRFRTIESGFLGHYDFDEERFPVDWHNTSRVEGLRFDFGLSFPQSKSFRDNASVNITSPIAYSVFWDIGPNAAQKAIQSLDVVMRNTKVVYASTIFDVTKSPRFTPVFTGRQGGTHQPEGVLISPVSTAVYGDGLLKKKIWDAPLIVPRQPVLQTAKSPPPKEELYLWQPEVQVAILDKHDPDLVQRSDLVVAATSVFQADAEYYLKGAALSHRIRDLDRSNLLGHRIDKKRANGWRDYWDKDFQPFFPASFFEPGYAVLSGDAGNRLRDVHFEVLRKRLQQQLQKTAGEFRLESTIVVDRDRATAELKPGDSYQQFAPIAGSLPDAKELGFIARLTTPQGSGRRRFDNDESATDFSVVFPAMKSRLRFEVDSEKLPAHKPTNDDERYKGDLVVRIAKVQRVTDRRLGPQTLFYVRPLRFECLGTAAPNASVNERLAKSGKTAFTLPVDIPEFNEAQ